MANLYLTDTYLTQAHLTVVHARELPNGLAEIALADTIGRPKGGGQPADKCFFTHGGVRFEIGRVSKQSEKPFFTVYEYEPFSHPLPSVGDEIEFEVDVERRLDLSKRHTLTHVVMGAIRRNVSDYQSRGAEIYDDGRTCSLWFNSSRPVEASQLAEIDMSSRSIVTDELEVRAVSEKSIDIAESKYSAWRVDGTLGLSGKIRTILIGPDWDANPCSGTHVRSTGEIGPFVIDQLLWNGQRECWEIKLGITKVWSNWYGE